MSNWFNLGDQDNRIVTKAKDTVAKIMPSLSLYRNSIKERPATINQTWGGDHKSDKSEKRIIPARLPTKFQLYAGNGLILFISLEAS